MNRELLFPTPVYIQGITDYKNLNKDLLKNIKAWAKQTSGEIKTNAGGGWHSPTTMGDKEEYKPLLKELNIMVAEIFKDYGLKMPFFLGNMWANINYPGSYNKTHLHPNSTLSGAYYVQVPKNSGCIWVEDPRPGPNLLMPQRLDKLPKPLWRVVKYPAVEGQCLMFPAWLPHGVECNDSKEKGVKGWRVSISFNFIQK